MAHRAMPLGGLNGLSKQKLIEALKYSDLGITENSTEEEILTALREKFPIYWHLYSKGTSFWHGLEKGATVNINENNVLTLAGYFPYEGASVGLYTDYFDITNIKTITIRGKVYERIDWHNVTIYLQLKSKDGKSIINLASLTFNSADGYNEYSQTIDKLIDVSSLSGEYMITAPVGGALGSHYGWIFNEFIFRA